MFQAWQIAVVLNARSNAARVFAQTSSGAQNAANSVNGATRSVNAHTVAVNRMAQAAKIANVAVVGIGIVLGAAMLKGVKGAADLESALVNVRNATGATASQMDGLRQEIFKTSAATAQSVVDTANVVKVMATSGINDPVKLRNIIRPAAMFADVQFLSRGVPFEEGAKQAIQVAHLYQAYDPKQVEPLFNQLTKLSQMMPDNLNRYLTQAGYYMPLFRRMGVDPKESLVLGAWMDRMGLGRGKGGTGLQQFLLQQMQPLQMTGHMQGKRADALAALGLLNKDGSAKYLETGKDGQVHFHVIDALRQINNEVQYRTAGLTGHAKAVATQSSIVDIQKALGVQGGHIGFLGTPESVAQLDQMLKQLAKMPSMYEMQRRAMDTLNGQTQLFRTNVSSMLTDAMWGSLPFLKNEMHALAEAAHQAQIWIHGHRQETNSLVRLALIPIGWAILQIGFSAARTMIALGGLPSALDRTTAALGRMGIESAAAGGQIGLAGGQVGAAGVAAGRASTALLGLSAALNIIAGIGLLLAATEYAGEKSGLLKRYQDMGNSNPSLWTAVPTANGIRYRNSLTGEMRLSIPTGRSATGSSSGDIHLPPNARGERGTTIHVQTLNVYLPKGSGPQHAKAVVDALTGLRSGARGSGSGGNSLPTFSAAELR